jgi:prepilin-type N-terminal cleavage/methylation domain-containing protein
MNQVSLRRRTGQSRGFTLVELLVVIGIIAILIGILLPALQAARRQSYQTKCMASLREIGHAIMMYSMDNKGYWPLAALRLPDPDTSPSSWRAWADTIAPYVTKAKIEKRADIDKARRNSVLWGCPAYRATIDYSTAPGGADMVYTGYGMNYLPPTYWASGKLEDQSIRTVGVPNGKYARFTVWQQKASDRMIVTDAIWEFIKVCSTPLKRSTVELPGYDSTTGWPSELFVVDPLRHAKPGTPKKAVWSTKSLSILYCDGHAAPGSVIDAYNAIYSPGRDSTK